MIEAGGIEMASEVKAGFDPNQVRDPHTGEWVDMPGLPDLPSVDSLGLTGEQSAALDVYQSARYTQVNRFLRTGGTDAEAERLAAELDGVFEKTPPLQGSTTVWRGTSNRLEDFFPSLEGDPIGKVIEDPAFNSTTADRSIAEDFTGTSEGDRIISTRGGDLWRIVIPPGKKVLMMSDTKAEEEVLINRGTRFRIVGVSQSPRGYRLIDVEVLP